MHVASQARNTLLSLGGRQLLGTQAIAMRITNQNQTCTIQLATKPKTPKTRRNGHKMSQTQSSSGLPSLVHEEMQPKQNLHTNIFTCRPPVPQPRGFPRESQDLCAIDFIINTLVLSCIQILCYTVLIRALHTQDDIPSTNQVVQNDPTNKPDTNLGELHHPILQC